MTDTITHTLAPDLATIEWHLSEHFRGITDGYLTVCWPDVARSDDDEDRLLTRWFHIPDEIPAAARFTCSQAEHTNIWFGVCPRREKLPGRKRGAAADVAALTAVYADVDWEDDVHEKSNLPPDEAAALDVIHRVGLAPTLVLNTGHGLQAYWYIDNPLLLVDADARQQAKELLDRFKATIQHHARVAGEYGVDSVQDLPRILRPAGTLNHKDPLDVRPVRIIGEIDSEARYSLDDFRTYLIDRAAAPPAVSTPAPRPAANLADEALIEKAKAASNGRVFSRLFNGVTADHNNDASAADLALCNHLAFWTNGDAAQVDRVFRQSGLYRPKWDARHSSEGLTYGQMTVGKAMASLNGRGYSPEYRSPGKPSTNGSAPPAAAGGGEGCNGGPPPPVAAVEEPTPDIFPDPVPLVADPPPEMDDETRPPGWLGEMIEAVSNELETPQELATAMGLTAVATAVQGVFRLKVTGNYREPLNTYSAAAYPPGGRKTDVVKRMLGPVWAWERTKKEEFAPILKKWQADDAVLKVRIAGTLAKIKAATEADELAELQAELETLNGLVTPEPFAPRLTAEDCTPEHVATLLGRHDQRLTIQSDEGGIFDTWGGRYSANGTTANIDVFLKAWSTSPVRVDRGSRPSIHLTAPHLSVGILPQPSVVEQLLGNETFRRRGLVARFFLFVPPSRLGYRDLDGTPVPQEVSDSYDQRLTALLNITPDRDRDGSISPMEIELDDDAVRQWQQFRAEVEQMMKRDGVLEHLTDFGGKLPGMAVRTAGLYHLVEHGPDTVYRRSVSGRCMAKAIALAKFAAKHFAHAAGQADPKGDLAAARRLWRGIENATVPTPNDIVTARDLWQPTRGMFKRMPDAEGGIRTLVERGYLVELPHPDAGKPGRPSRKFRVNPKAREEGFGCFAHMSRGDGD